LIGFNKIFYLRWNKTYNTSFYKRFLLVLSPYSITFRDQNMQFIINKQEKYSILTLNEEKLTSIIAPELKSEIIKLSEEGFANIILDVSKVKYVDSSGLSSILTGNRLANDKNGKFILSAPGEYVMKLITISKLDTILNIFPTNEESVDAIFLDELEKDITKEASSEE